MIEIVLSENVTTYVVIPLLILLSRIIDVSLGTIRLIFISKGQKMLSATLGFFEVLIWLIAITRIMENLTNVFAYIAYATGFSLGTYLGITLEEKIAIGKVIVRLTTSKDSKELVEELRNKKYIFTSIGVDGPNGEVKSIHAIINKKDLKKTLEFITTFDENAFYTVEDVKIVTEKKLAGNPSLSKSFFSKMK